MAEGRADAEKAFDHFLAKYYAKYDKATACLAKDRQALFHDFPAEHWKHIRTGNPIESTSPPFVIAPPAAKAACRTTPPSSWCSRLVPAKAGMILAAQSSWRRLDGQNQLPKLIGGIMFTDGIEANQKQAAA